MQKNLKNNNFDLTLNESPNKFHEEDIAALVNKAIGQGKAYLYAYPRVGRMIISGIFWPMTRIERIRGKDGEWEFKYDTTRTNIVIDSMTRTGPQDSEEHYQRILAKGELDLGDAKVRFVFPDTKAVDRFAAKAYVSRKNAQGDWVEEEEAKNINLRTSKDIHVKKYYENGQVQVDVTNLEDVQPDKQDGAKEDIKKVLKDAKDGFRPEQVAGMTVFNVDTNTYNTPNWREFDLEDQNFNSIKKYGRTLVWRHEGPTIWGLNISMEWIGWELRSLNASNEVNELNYHTRKCASDTFKEIRKLLDCNDKNIDDAIKNLETLCNHASRYLEDEVAQSASLKRHFLDVMKMPLQKIKAEKEDVERDVDMIMEHNQDIVDNLGSAEKDYSDILLENAKSAIYGNHDKKDKLTKGINDAHWLNKLIEVESHDQTERHELISEMADAAGKAKERSEKAEGKDDEEAKKAADNAKKKVIDDYLAAQNEKGENYQKAIKNIVEYVKNLQVREAIVEQAGEDAKSGSLNKKEIITYMGKKDIISEMKKISGEQLNNLHNELKQYLGQDVFKYPAHERKKNYKDEIDKWITDAKEEAGKAETLEKCQEVCREALGKVTKYLYLAKGDGKRVKNISAIEKAMDEVQRQKYDVFIEAGAKKAAEIIVGKDKAEGDLSSEALAMCKANLTSAIVSKIDGFVKDGTGESTKEIVNNIINEISDASGFGRAIESITDAIETNKKDNIIKESIRGEVNKIISKALGDARAKDKNKAKVGYEKEVKDKAGELTKNACKICEKKLTNAIMSKIDEIIKGNKKEEIKEELEKEEYKISSASALDTKITNIINFIKGNKKDDKKDEDIEKEVNKIIRKVLKESLRESYEHQVMTDDEIVAVEGLQKTAKGKLDDKSIESEIKVKECLGRKNEEKKGNMVAQYRLGLYDKEIAKQEEEAKDLAKTEKRNIKEIDIKKVIEALNAKIKEKEKEKEILAVKSRSLLSEGKYGEIDEKCNSNYEQLKDNRTDSIYLNGDQLIQKWYSLYPYAVAKEPSGETSSEERFDYYQKLAEREKIEKILLDDPGVHCSHQFRFCIAKAYEMAVHKDYYWWRDGSQKGVTENGVIIYLQKSIDKIRGQKAAHGTPQTRLGRSREAFLNQAMEALDFAMKDSHSRQSLPVLLPVLGAVHRILEANCEKPNYVKQALALEDPKEAKMLLEDKLNAASQKSVLGLDRPKEDPSKKEPSNVDLIDEKTMDGEYFKGQTKLKRSEFEELRGKIQKACYKRAGEIFESMLNGLNSEQRVIMERNRADMIKEIGKQTWEDYQKGEARMFELYKLKRFSKEIDKQRLKDMMFTWAFLCMQNGMMSANKGTDMIMRQLIKTIEHGN